MPAENATHSSPPRFNRPQREIKCEVTCLLNGRIRLGRFALSCSAQASCCHSISVRPGDEDDLSRMDKILSCKAESVQTFGAKYTTALSFQIPFLDLTLTIFTADFFCYNGILPLNFFQAKMITFTNPLKKKQKANRGDKRKEI